MVQIPVRLNVGSGQRRFDNAHGWINVDCVSRPPDQVPDLICDVGKEPLPYADGTVDMVVLCHVFEHFHLGDGLSVIAEAHRVLRDGGSLIIICPDVRALCRRWLANRISDYIFCVNMYGAWQGQPGDDHHWGWTYESLRVHLNEAHRIWSNVIPFNFREIAGSAIPQDWWMFGLEAIK